MAGSKSALGRASWCSISPSSRASTWGTCPTGSGEPISSSRGATHAVSSCWARALVGRLRATSSRPVVYAELPGAQHAFDLFHSLRYEAVVDAVEAFADRVRADRGAATIGAPSEEA